MQWSFFAVGSRVAVMEDHGLRHGAHMKLGWALPSAALYPGGDSHGWSTGRPGVPAMEVDNGRRREGALIWRARCSCP